MTTVKRELVPVIILKAIIDQKRELERILSKHKVKEPEEIEKAVEEGKLSEHPSYEDFLSAVALRSNIEEMILIDGSWIDVRYPVADMFSFHWQRDNKIFRIDTALHHKGIRSFPRHIHFGSEDNVIEDHVLEGNVSPEEKFRRFMAW